MFSELIPISVNAGGNVEICKWEGGDISNYLRLEYFTVTGNSPLRVGDDVLVTFRLRNVGKRDVVVEVFAVVERPDDSRAEVGKRRYDPLRIGEYVYFNAEVVVNRAGRWSIWPGFRILTSPSGQSPERWHECIFNVEPRPTTTTTTTTTPLPDLDITDVRGEYDLNTGTWTLRYTVRNIGEARADATTTEITIDNGRLTFYDNFPALNPGQESTRTIQGLVWTCVDSFVNIKFKVNYDNRIPESDRRNNIATMGKTCQIDLQLENVWQEGVFVELTETSTTVTTTRTWQFITPRYELVTKIFFTVKNRGAVNIQTFDAILFIDGELIETKQVGPLPAGERYTGFFDTRYRCSGMNDEVRVRIQATGDMDSSNNELSFVWRCTNPDLAVEDLAIIILDPASGARGIRFIVRNQGDAPSGHNTALLRLYRQGVRAGSPLEVLWEQYLAIFPLRTGESREIVIDHVADLLRRECRPDTPYFIVDVTVDVDQEITEIYEDNNFMRSSRFDCRPDHPDLLVESIRVEGFHIVARIRNDGGRPTDYQYQGRNPCRGAGSSVAWINIHNIIISYQCVPRIGASRVVDVSFRGFVFDWSDSRFRDRPTLTVTVVVDVYNQVLEYAREDNNRYEIVLENPGFVRVRGRILYQEAEALASSQSNPAQIQLGDFKPFRFGKIKFVEYSDPNNILGENFRYRSQIILTDSDGYFDTYIPRSVGRVIGVHIGGEDMNGELNRFVRVAKDLDRCNEYVGWNSIKTLTIPATGNLDFGVLRIGARQDIDFRGYVKETYISGSCGWTRSMQQRLGWEGGSGYFNIAETILVAKMYADAHRDDTDAIGRVSVEYPDPDWPHYENIYDEIQLSDPEGYYYYDTAFLDSVILHEYTHHLQYEISHAYEVGIDSHGSCYVDTAWWEGDIDDEAYALMEGFPEYFSHLLISMHRDPSDPYYLSDVGTSYSFYETPNCLDSELSALGIEGGVIALLLDSVDSSENDIEWPDSIDESFDGVDRYVDLGWRYEGLDDVIFRVFDDELDDDPIFISSGVPTVEELFYDEEGGVIGRVRDFNPRLADQLEELYRYYGSLIL